jgi:hypothetical protein
MVNGCGAQRLVACQDVIALDFMPYGVVIRAIDRKVCLKQADTCLSADPIARIELRA